MKKAYQGTTKKLPFSQTSAYRAAYRLANLDRIREQERAWREANQDKVKASSKKYYEEHREEELARVDEWRKANPEKVRESQRKCYTKRATTRTQQGLNILTGKPIQSRTGSLYIIECEGRFKIGYTRDMTERRYKMSTNSPFPVTVVYESDTIEGVNFVETALHKKFSDKLIKGEWYALNKTNVKNIKTIVNKITKADHTITV